MELVVLWNSRENAGLFDALPIEKEDVSLLKDTWGPR